MFSSMTLNATRLKFSQVLNRREKAICRAIQSKWAFFIFFDLIFESVEP